MKRSLLLAGAAVALALTVTPSVAQDRTGLSKQDRAVERQGNSNEPARRESETTRDRSTNAQAPSESTEQTTPKRDQESSGGSREKATQGADQRTTPSERNRASGTNGSQNAGRAEQGQQSPSARQNAQTGEPSQRNTGKAARSGESAAPSQQRSAGTTSGSQQPQTRASASLDPQAKTRLRSAVARLDAKPATNVNFSVSVGTVVPDRVALLPLPTSIVEIVPQYRGYDYFVVRDEVVIVQPRTHKIVDVIERSGPSRARASTTVHKPKLSAHQREIIRRHVESSRTVTTGAAPQSTTTIEIGESVPDAVEIQSFPEEVYREVPEIRSYRYIERGGDVYLVDPGDRQVIEEIR